MAKYVYTFYPLRPEHVREELFGRIYQFGLPPETRKNLGAFFTKPQAAKLLASLAIERWDDKVLDLPADQAHYWLKLTKPSLGRLRNKV